MQAMQTSGREVESRVILITLAQVSKQQAPAGKLSIRGMPV